VLLGLLTMIVPQESPAVKKFLVDAIRLHHQLLSNSHRVAILQLAG
jgi:hypothetical protein